MARQFFKAGRSTSWLARLTRGGGPALVMALGVAACGGQSALCSFRGTVNAPENRTLRRNAMATGLKEFCRLATLSNVPLQLQSGGPNVGRFYPQSCMQREADNGDLIVQLAGRGYAFNPLTKKITFTMSASVQYNQDFLVADKRCDIYGYFRPRQVTSNDFKIDFIEQPAAQFVNQLSNVGQDFGKQLLGDKLQQGFTVIMLEDGGNDFSQGILDVGKKPYKPLQVGGKNRVPVENLRIEVHQNQRDFAGPVAVNDKGRSLYLTAQVDGGVDVDVFVMRRAEAEASLKGYLDQASVGPLSGTPVWSDVIPAGQTGFARRIPVPAGVYYVVFDNSPHAGQVAPPQSLLDDRAALIDYAIQIGDSK